MKTAFLLLILLMTVSGYAQPRDFKSPDILIDSKLSSDWSGLLISKLRRVLRNYGQADPFRQKFDNPITVHESEVMKYLNPEAKDMIGNLGKALGLDFLGGKTSVVVHGLRYDVRGFKTDLKLFEENQYGVTVAAGFAASNVRVNADKIVVSLVIPGNKLPIINIEILNPIVAAEDDSLIKFSSLVELGSEESKFKINLREANFGDMAKNLLGTKKIKPDFSRVIVPAAKVEIGNKVINISPEKVEKWVFSQKEAIKGILLAQFSSFLAKGFGKETTKIMNEIAFKKQYWLNTDTIMTMLKFKTFESFNGDDHVLATMDGDFCTKPAYLTLKNECMDKRVTALRKSRITEELHDASLDSMRDFVEDGDANIVVSISEDYVNKILATTLDAGLWQKMLEGQGVVLGPNKPFIRLDEKGSKTGTLFLDMIYTTKTMERLAVGSKEVRFPLLMKVSLKILEANKVPVFAIYVNEVDTTENTLINGRPELGVVGNLAKLRFKKKILAAIREETKALNNTEVLRLAYKPLEGLDLDKVNFVSDGYGRMNALLLLKTIPDEPEAN